MNWQRKMQRDYQRIADHPNAPDLSDLMREEEEARNAQKRRDKEAAQRAEFTWTRYMRNTTGKDWCFWSGDPVDVCTAAANGCVRHPQPVDTKPPCVWCEHTSHDRPCPQRMISADGKESWLCDCINGVPAEYWDEG